ncbi:MAG: hypothetical protein ACE3JP_13705 [Ectobacillus sp.]
MPQQNQECQSCCQGNEILCVSIPCPIDIVLLGIDLQLELPCLRLSSGQTFNSAQIQQLLQVLIGLLGGLGSLGSNE